MKKSKKKKRKKKKKKKRKSEERRSKRRGRRRNPEIENMRQIRGVTYTILSHNSNMSILMISTLYKSTA